MAAVSPTVVAHRGASAARPENTMTAFEWAKTAGAGAIEFDVHATSDGALVVHHDFTLDRTTSGTGLVVERPLAYVRALDAGSWFDPAYSGERVPLLDEVLAIEGIELELELKGFGATFLEAAVETVVARGALGRTEFTSFNLPMLVALKRAHPEARLGLFTRRREPWMPESILLRQAVSVASLGGFDVVHVFAADVTPRIVAALHAEGFVVHANDAADEGEMRGALGAGVDRFSANDLGLAVEVAAGG
jgi:glycerophosphoryl diester phosphodiesterase